MKLLIVDNDERNGFQLRSLLEECGYEVIYLSDGSVALSWAQREEPDAVICDVLTPMLDGYILCHRWKHDQRLKHIPFVFYTDSFSLVEDGAFASSLGADQVVPRSAGFDFLLQTLGEVIKRSQKEALNAFCNGSDDQGRIQNLESRVVELEAECRQQQEDIALRKSSEEKFRALIMAFPELVWLKDPDGVYLDCNPRFEEFFGALGSEIKGKTDYDFVSRELADFFREQDKLSIAAGTACLNEEAVTYPDGHQVILETIKAPLREDDGELIGVLGIARDITERKQAEKELLDSERRFKALHNATFGGIAIHDRGVILECNRGLSDISGYTVDELIGMDGLLLIAERVRSVVMDHIVEGYEEPYESIGLRKDGGEYPLRLAAKNIPYNGKDVRVVEFRDISDIKAAEQEKGLLIAAVEQAVEIVVITDATASIQYVNAAFEQATGYSRDEVVGENPRILKSGKQDAAFYEAMWKSLLTGAPWSGRLVNRKKNGALYTEEATISPIRDENGNIVSFVAVKRDITTQLVLEEQYRQSQKMETVGRLAGGIAHDFNNILQTITGFCEILMVDMDRHIGLHSGDESCVLHREDVGEIYKAARLAAVLTRQLLSFSRKQPVENQHVDLNVILTDGVRILQQSIDERVQLDFCLSEEELFVRADPSQIMQILMNLMVNARDAMPHGGEIQVTTERVRICEEDLREQVHARVGEFCCLKVSDTGIGMNKSQLAHLFEPFFTSKTPGKGTGLGLAVVYGIVQDHQGWIHVESTDGAGSTFSIYFPRCDSIETQAGPSKAREGVDSDDIISAEKRILLVDDDTIVRDLAGEILQNMGFMVDRVDTVQEAQDLFALEPKVFDLLFIDVMLPDGNGVDLADHLRKQRADIPVLLFSGYSDEEVNLELIEKRGFCYMRKPFSLKKIMDAVEEAIHSI